MSRLSTALLAITATCLLPAPGSVRAADAFHFDASPLNAKQIDGYLATKRDKKKNQTSPLHGHADSLLRHGQKFDIDPRLMTAIAGQESSFGLHLCGDHNAWNWFWGGSCRNSPFVSYERAIEVVSKYMRKSYLNKGYNTIPLIQKKYCIDGCQHWINGVTYFYKELQEVKPGGVVAPAPKPKTKPKATATVPPESPPDDIATPASDTGHTLRNKLWLQGAGIALLLMALLGGTGYLAYRMGRQHGSS